MKSRSNAGKPAELDFDGVRDIWLLAAMSSSVEVEHISYQYHTWAMAPTGTHKLRPHNRYSS